MKETQNPGLLICERQWKPRSARDTDERVVSRTRFRTLEIVKTREFWPVPGVFCVLRSRTHFREHTEKRPLNRSRCMRRTWVSVVTLPAGFFSERMAWFSRFLTVVNVQDAFSKDWLESLGVQVALGSVSHGHWSQVHLRTL